MYSYLTDDSSEQRKTKWPKKCVIKRKLKFGNFKNCLEVTQFDNRINYLEKSKIDIDSFFFFLNKETFRIHKKKKKNLLKTKQRFKIERHSVFTEETNKIASSLNGDIGMQSIEISIKWAKI